MIWVIKVKRKKDKECKAIEEAKKIIKLYSEKKELEEEVDSLYDERDSKDNAQTILFVSYITVCLVSFIAGFVFMGVGETIKIKIIGGFLVGFVVGGVIAILVESTLEDLSDSIKKIDEEIDEKEKRIAEIEKVIDDD